MNKYFSKKVILDGVTFHSKKEASRYSELKLLQSAGKIYDLKLQPRFTIQEKFKHPTLGHIRAIEYIADFSYSIRKEYHVEDVKGFKTKDYLIKRKLFLFKYQEYHFHEI